MAKTHATRNLDSLPKLKRWLGKAWGMEASIADVLGWLEHDEQGRALKSSLTIMMVRDVARLGTPADLKAMVDMEYDLSQTCTYQVDGGALHVAAQYGKHANASALMECGLTPQSRVYSLGPSALDEALTNGHLGLFEKLLEHAQDITQEDRNLWLLAAVSIKTRQGKQSTDAPKNKTVRYVLKNHGPFSQEVLDGVLANHVAPQGWLETFKTLVDAGANPAAPSVLVIGNAVGSSLLMLFSKLAPALWPRALNLFADRLDILYPPRAEEGSQALDIQGVFEQRCLKRTSMATGEIPALLDGLAARRRAQTLGDTWQPVALPARARRM